MVELRSFREIGSPCSKSRRVEVLVGSECSDMVDDYIHHDVHAARVDCVDKSVEIGI